MAWENEDHDWRMKIFYFSSIQTLKEVSGTVRYSLWWRLSDDQPILPKQCEDMIKLICGASRLKCDDPRLRNAARVDKMCELCSKYEVEDAKHVILYCTYVNEIRAEMYECFNAMPDNLCMSILDGSDNIYYTLLGKPCKEIDENIYREFNVIASSYISKMYRMVVRDRQGIG